MHQLLAAQMCEATGRSGLLQLPTTQSVHKNVLSVQSFAVFEVKNDALDKAGQLIDPGQSQLDHP